MVGFLSVVNGIWMQLVGTWPFRCFVFAGRCASKVSP